MARPVVYAVARSRAGGRFTYTTPHWPDARGYLLGLLEQHAAMAIAAAAVDVARRARAAAHQVPTAPPADAWGVQLGECRYSLACEDVAPARARARGIHSASGSLSRRRRRHLPPTWTRTSPARSPASSHLQVGAREPACPRPRRGSWSCTATHRRPHSARGGKRAPPTSPNTRTSIKHA
jgi:hypothetical protein